jgi:hypothetical protein
LAATIATVPGGEDVWGKHRVKLITLTGDNSYPAGGYAISAQQVGLRSIVGVDPVGVNTAGIGIAFVWNTTTGKLQFIYPTQTGTSQNVGGDAPAGTNMTGITATFLVIGLDD